MGWIKNIYNYVKTSKAVKKAYKDEDIVNKFSQLYGVKFKCDWVGRLYAVISPALQNIQDNGTTQIFEFGKDGLSDKTYLTQWIMIKLNAVEKLIAAQNLLDVLTFDIREVIMDGEPTGNYLIIFSPVGFQEFSRSLKNILWTTLGVIVTGILAVGIYLLCV